MKLQVLMLPQAGGGMPNYATQAGVGLCSYKTTEQKLEAVGVFAKWFAEESRNLEFVINTGYMPVLNGAFEKIDCYNFPSDAQKNLYSAILQTKQKCTLISEPSNPIYWPKVYDLYDKVRGVQRDLKNKKALGLTTESIADELLHHLKNIK